MAGEQSIQTSEPDARQPTPPRSPCGAQGNNTPFPKSLWVWLLNPVLRSWFKAHLNESQTPSLARTQVLFRLYRPPKIKEANSQSS